MKCHALEKNFFVRTMYHIKHNLLYFKNFIVNKCTWKNSTGLIKANCTFWVNHYKINIFYYYFHMPDIPKFLNALQIALDDLVVHLCMRKWFNSVQFQNIKLVLRKIYTITLLLCASQLIFKGCEKIRFHFRRWIFAPR